MIRFPFKGSKNSASLKIGKIAEEIKVDKAYLLKYIQNPKPNRNTAIILCIVRLRLNNTKFLNPGMTEPMVEV